MHLRTELAERGQVIPSSTPRDFDDTSDATDAPSPAASLLSMSSVRTPPPPQSFQNPSQAFLQALPAELTQDHHVHEHAIKLMQTLKTNNMMRTDNIRNLSAAPQQEPITDADARQDGTGPVIQVAT